MSRKSLLRRTFEVSIAAACIGVTSIAAAVFVHSLTGRNDESPVLLGIVMGMFALVAVGTTCNAATAHHRNSSTKNAIGE